MYYLITLTTSSSGTVNRVLTPYSDRDTCIRKFHEAFSSVGGGSKKISALILNDIDGGWIDSLGVEHKTSQVTVERNETWTETEVITSTDN